MNPQFGVIAAEAREEIAFWPIATGGYLFVQTESWIVFTLLIVALIPAAVTYLFLKQLRRLISSESEISLAQSDTNSEVVSERVEEIVGDLEEAGLELNPIMVGLTGIFSSILYFQLIRQIFMAGNPDLIAMGLFLIPLVTGAVALTPYFR